MPAMPRSWIGLALPAMVLTALLASRATGNDPAIGQIEQLREALGPAYRTPADPREFSQALDNAGNPQPAYPRPAPPPQFDGRRPRVGPALTPVRDPKRLLLETAFELEKLAHRLDLADLTSEADRVREAAVALRRQARAPVKRPGDPSPS